MKIVKKEVEELTTCPKCHDLVNAKYKLDDWDKAWCCAVCLCDILIEKGYVVDYDREIK